MRCDNGPDYISNVIQVWAARRGIAMSYIQRGSPQQNAYVERFNHTVRYEWLSQYHWQDLGEVRICHTIDLALLSRTYKHGLGRDKTNTAVGYSRLTLLLFNDKNGGVPTQMH
ncbi:MAG: integrase core domain-containing protein [Methylophilaceae bacterium]|nr:MAG: integrase core domain-containing protein [Methylophilaceae bacterium]